MSDQPFNKRPCVTCMHHSMLDLRHICTRDELDEHIDLVTGETIHPEPYDCRAERSYSILSIYEKCLGNYWIPNIKP